jgi:hypothetical protein
LGSAEHDPLDVDDNGDDDEDESQASLPVLKINRANKEDGWKIKRKAEPSDTGSFLNSGPLLTSPLGANFDPRAEVVPQGRILPPGSEIVCSPLHSSKQYLESVHPQG